MANEDSVSAGCGCLLVAIAFAIVAAALKSCLG